VFERFNLHANVRIPAEDDTGRERLCRYIMRPPFALGRFRRLRDGNIAYRVKKVSRHRATERVMTPVECLARLASIVAPPHYPLARLHGVFGARHRWRARIVPKPPAATKSSAPCQGRARDPSTPSLAPERAAVNGAARPLGDGQAALALHGKPALAEYEAGARPVELHGQGARGATVPKDGTPARAGGIWASARERARTNELQRKESNLRRTG
jgi:hypothetical protein